MLMRCGRIRCYSLSLRFHAGLQPAEEYRMVSKIGVAGASLFFLAAAFCSGRAAAVEVVWSHRTAAGQMAGSPAMGDVDGDGVDELATADTAGVVSLFRGNGEVVWQRRVPSPVTIAPSLADVYTDAVEGAQSPLELLVVNGLGTVYCLDAGTGRLIWEYVLPHGVDWGNTALSVCDIEQDGALEIITGDMEGGVVCLTGDGEARWQYAGAHGHTLCPASADLDGDGLLETLIAGNKTALVCLSPEGSVLWELGEGKGRGESGGVGPGR
jgi:outer membrane protein assembly factor BamB